MEQRREQVELRPAVGDDDARIVEITNLHTPDSLPLTLARYRTEYTEEHRNAQGERYVATSTQGVIGFGSFHWAWWTGEPSIYASNIQVLPDYLRQGIGTSLFDLIRTRLQWHEAKRLTGWVQADTTGGREFANRQGFQETGLVVQDYLLEIATADTQACPILETRLRQEGLRIAPLSELAHSDPTFLHELHRLWADYGDEVFSRDQLQNSFDAWRQQVLEAPGLSPETHWIALEGERPVGMSFLKRLSDDAFETDYTGVAKSHRGRGIATALKLHSLSWAQQEGVKWFSTSSEINNSPMIAIHTRLGYRPGQRRRQVECNLTP